jgi:sugar O-acyltransferase (sialic acid O-acetyltransferase NeuD family)
LKSIVVIGAGEQAKVIADILCLEEKYHIKGFLHTKKDYKNKVLIINGKRYKILGNYHEIDKLKLKEEVDYCIVGVGDNTDRRNYFEELKRVGFKFINVIHPTAYISKSAKLGIGLFIGPYVVINTQAIIGDNVIINSQALVEHDCIIEANAFISIGVKLAGGVRVENSAFIGAGAIILDNIKIGESSIVYAGSLVTKNIDKYKKVVGIPAKELGSN